MSDKLWSEIKRIEGRLMRDEMLDPDGAAPMLTSAERRRLQIELNALKRCVPETET